MADAENMAAGRPDDIKDLSDVGSEPKPSDDSLEPSVQRFAAETISAEQQLDAAGARDSELTNHAETTGKPLAAASANGSENPADPSELDIKSATSVRRDFTTEGKRGRR